MDIFFVCEGYHKYPYYYPRALKFKKANSRESAIF